MTDVAERTVPRAAVDTELHTNAEARRRLKKRYAAEARFKAMGLGAVGAAALFLAIFLYSIVSEGVPAFFQNYVKLEIPLDRAEIDPNNTRNPEILGQANVDGMVARAVRGFFPQITDRAGQRQLQSLISSGAPTILRREIIANPDRLGSTVTIQVPTDDLVDLYLKGRLTRLEDIRPGGEIGVSGRTGTVRLDANTNVFEPILAQAKLQMAARARELRRQAALQDRAAARSDAERTGFAQRAAEARGDERAALERQASEAANAVTAARANIQRLSAEATDLEARSTGAGRMERLPPTLSSYVVRLNGGAVKLTSVGNTSAEGTVLLPLTSADTAAPGSWHIKRIVTPETNRRLNDQQIMLVETMRERGAIEQSWSRQFFFGGASREPELAGVWSAIVGSFVTLAVTLLLAFPIGVAAAIYLEEFAPKNRFTEIVEVNINNLAAVPSIIFGLLGLAVFLNAFDLPRSAPLVGGMVLALMTLPIIIIASRAAVRAVPPSIREAALGVGASHQQAVAHHVLPLAMPGILTGTILGMAHALGETAPLLMIGMVAFVVEPPTSIFDPATLLPVQIFMWADFPEVAFQNKTAGAIIILLLFLICMNAIAVFLRKKFERRW